MTTPEPYSHDFAVPPDTATAATITEDKLPPVPPRPHALTVGVVLLGLCGLAFLVGGVWQTIAEFVAPGPRTFAPSLLEILLWTLYPLLTCAAIAVLGRSIWLGSPSALILGLLGTGYAMIRVVAFGHRLIEGLTLDGSAGSATLLFADPHGIGLSVAAGFALPALVLLAWPSSRRWSRRAGMIRQIRALIRKGRPVTRLPNEVFD